MLSTARATGASLKRIQRQLSGCQRIILNSTSDLSLLRVRSEAVEWLPTNNPQLLVLLTSTSRSKPPSEVPSEAVGRPRAGDFAGVVGRRLCRQLHRSDLPRPHGQVCVSAQIKAQQRRLQQNKIHRSHPGIILLHENVPRM